MLAAHRLWEELRKGLLNLGEKVIVSADKHAQSAHGGRRKQKQVLI